jgi:hypothetical protein
MPVPPTLSMPRATREADRRADLLVLGGGVVRVGAAVLAAEEAARVGVPSSEGTALLESVGRS